MRGKLAGLLLWSALCGSALAQGGGPANTVPFGQGAGRSFGFMGPCLSGVPLVGMGAGSAPICGALGAYAPLASPVFTGNPTAPTPATSDNDTSVATTAYVQTNISSYINVLNGGVIYRTRADAVAATIPINATAVELLGYSSPGDSGIGAVYFPMTCPVIVAPDFQDAGSRCWKLTVKTPTAGMFGVDMTGAADSTTQLAAFHDYAYRGNKCGKWGAGTIKYSGTITYDAAINPGNGPCFDGEGTRFTCFNNTNTTSHDIVLDTTVNGMNGGRLANFAFCHATQKTAGYGITQSEDATGEGINANFLIDNVQFVKTAGGIWLKNAQNCAISNIFVYNLAPNQNGLYLGDSATHTVIGCTTTRIWILNGEGDVSTSAIRIGNRVGGLMFSHCHLQGGSPDNMDYGIFISGTVTVADLWFSDCYADAFAKNQIRVDGGVDIGFYNSTYANSASGFSCIRIAGGTLVTIQGNLIYGCQRNGIEVLVGATSVKIDNNAFARNGFEGAGTNNYDDVFIAANTLYFTVTNNSFCEPTITLPIATTAVRYNVNVATGASNHYTITGNATGAIGTSAATGQCHVTGGVADAGTGTNKNVSGNPGSSWQTYTPTVSCDVSSPTTAAATARYQIKGPEVTVQVRVNVTTVGGTCTGSLRATAPVGANATGNIYVGSGYNATGVVSIPFQIQQTAGSLLIWRTGAAPLANDYYGTITYEAVAP